MSRALGVRVARLAGRLGRARRGFGWPAGPVEGWPEGELDRLERLIAAGGGLDVAATERLTDADLEWLAGRVSGPAGVEEDADAGEAGPEEAPPLDRGSDGSIDFGVRTAAR